MQIDVEVTITNVKVFDFINEAEEVLAESEGDELYTYHTEGRDNWLEKGSSKVNALGYVLLPRGLPYMISLAPDLPANLPCLYELDEDDESTGRVEFFCSEECLLEGSRDSNFGKFDCGRSRAWTSGSVCDNCGCELDEVEDDAT